ncbi:hypothetical protein ACW4YW_13205 [Methylobacillus pratensis]
MIVLVNRKTFLCPRYIAKGVKLVGTIIMILMSVFYRYTMAEPALEQNSSIELPQEGNYFSEKVIIPEALDKNGVPLTEMQRRALIQQSTAQAILEGVRSGVVPQPSGISPADLMNQQSKALMEQKQVAKDARPSALVSAGAAAGGLTRDLWEAATSKTANTDVDSSWDVGQHRREYTSLYPRELWHSFERTRNEDEYNALKARYAERSEREAAMAAHPWVSGVIRMITDPLVIMVVLLLVWIVGRTQVKALVPKLGLNSNNFHRQKNK